MNVLIVGFGSIGKKHLKTIQSLNISFEKIYVYDIKDISDKHLYTNIIFIDKYKSILSQIDYCFICTPPETLHDYVIDVLFNSSARVFVEKPAVASYDQALLISKLPEQYKNRLFVGFNLRYHPCVMHVKKYIDSLNDVYYAYFECSSYLPHWRKSDYKENYAVTKYGGIVIDDIHEIDLAQFLLGNLTYEASNTLNVKSITTINENSADILLSTMQNSSVMIHMDYLNKSSVRKFKIYSTSSNIECDLTNGLVQFDDFKTKVTFHFENPYETMFNNEIISFFKNEMCKWSDIVTSHEIIMFIKQKDIKSIKQ